MLRIMTSLLSATLIMCIAFTELDGADALLCDRAMFDYKIYNQCVLIYKNHMAAFNYQDECPWDSTQLYYTKLDDCVKNVGNKTACTEPSLKNEIFLDVHRTYFLHCHFLKDPDVPVLLLLMMPCIIITVFFPLFCSCVTPSE